MTRDEALVKAALDAVRAHLVGLGLSASYGREIADIDAQAIIASVPEPTPAWAASARAVTEIHQLRTRIAELEAAWEQMESWKKEGETLFDQREWGAMFHIGEWWADRPWRNRDPRTLA